MTVQFLGVENGNRPFKFGGSLRLFLPIAVWRSFVGPADEIGRDNVRDSASHAFSLLYVEITRRGLRMRREFWDASHICSPINYQSRTAQFYAGIGNVTRLP
jgi:hypothetical protein